MKINGRSDEQLREDIAFDELACKGMRKKFDIPEEEEEELNKLADDWRL